MADGGGGVAGQVDKVLYLGLKILGIYTGSWRIVVLVFLMM